MGRYLLYAAGEILLVMVGILLALQVNNWNEARRAKELETKYLYSLKEEFEQNLVELDKTVAQVSSQIESAENLLKLTGPEPAEISINEFSKNYMKALKDYSKFYPISGVLQDLMSSGNLNVISNSDLREKLASWQTKLDILKEHEKEAEAYSFNSHRHIVEFGSLRKQIYLSEGLQFIGESKFSVENRDLLRLVRFESYLSGFTIISTRLKNTHYASIRKEIEAILELIQKELS